MVDIAYLENWQERPCSASPSGFLSCHTYRIPHRKTRGIVSRYVDENGFVIGRCAYPPRAAETWTWKQCVIVGVDDVVRPRRRISAAEAKAEYLNLIFVRRPRFTPSSEDR